jgi:predicted DCC family thiol-disulfide oxidoreductase YuxK
VNDLHLLGYDRSWSSYAALHGSFLGWILVGCFAFLAKRPGASRLYLWGCYLTLVFFLLIAFGIDGVPHIKRIGVVGLTFVVPGLIGLYAFEIKNRNSTAFRLSALSFVSIVASMGLALGNEFWVTVPMVVTHGLLNAVLTVPCFYFAVRYGREGATKSVTTKDNVVFFDGVCVLCNGTVDILMKVDSKRIFKYSSLQGEHARKVLEPRHVDSVSSVILRSGGAVYEKSEAVVRVLLMLGGIYKVAGLVMSAAPYFILDKLYDFVARNRYSVFGKTDSCSIPAAEDKHLFIP